jgi:hypothetical protein
VSAFRLNLTVNNCIDHFLAGDQAQIHGGQKRKTPFRNLIIGTACSKLSVSLESFIWDRFSRACDRQ